jgi:hypothetical protein
MPRPQRRRSSLSGLIGMAKSDQDRLAQIAADHERKKKSWFGSK